MSTMTTAPHSHGVPQLLTSGLRSYEPSDFEPVSTRQETWRFTPIALFEPLLEKLDGVTSVSVEPNFDPTQVSIVTSAFSGDPVDGYVPTDRLASNIWRNAANSTQIRVARGAVVDAPINVTLASEKSASSSVLIIELEQESQASVVIQHRGTAAQGSTIIVTLGNAASADITLVQDTTAPIAVYAHHSLARDSELKSAVVTLGGPCTRVVPTVACTGAGADALLNGIALAGPGDHIEHRSLVNHEVPNCRSNVAYKNLLNGSADSPSRTVWIGDVIIHAAALGTDTYELNRNPVIGDHARADSVPNLEIETGEIAGAGHASATGRLDDEQVFYMQSRGISESEAKRLIVRGFFEDLLGQIKHESVVDSVRNRLEGLLG